MRLARGLGSAHVDHRLRQLDFADDAVATAFGLPVAEVDQVRGGPAGRLRSAPRDAAAESPPASGGQARRHASMRSIRRTSISTTGWPAKPWWRRRRMVDALLSLAEAAVASRWPARRRRWPRPSPARQGDAGRCRRDCRAQGGSAVVIVSARRRRPIRRHPGCAPWRASSPPPPAAATTNCRSAPMRSGSPRVGVLPGNGGLDAQAMLAKPRKGYVLYGVEPPHDFADGAAALKALQRAEHVVAFSAFASAAMREVADVILPIALLPEMDATLVNVDGLAQGVAAGAKAPGQARAGWKVLRALGGALRLDGFRVRRHRRTARSGIGRARRVPRRRTGARVRRPRVWHVLATLADLSQRCGAAPRRGTATRIRSIARRPCDLNADEAAAPAAGRRRPRARRRRRWNCR